MAVLRTMVEKTVGLSLVKKAGLSRDPFHSTGSSSFLQCLQCVDRPVRLETVA